MKIISKYGILLIIIIAAFLRLWNLGNVPPHMTPDEASLGYNAYSILKTGRDEHGQFMPFIFKSFGDYKPGLYVYFTVPFVALIGLTEYAVRLPSALAGIISVWMLYKISTILFNNKKIALATSVMLALSPWAIQFSRGAWEVNFALMLTLVAVHYFLKSLEEQKYFVISIILFSATLLTYQGSKISSLIVMGILTLFYLRNISTFRAKTIIAALVAGMVVSLPIILSIFGPESGRLSVFSVFSYPREEQYLLNFLNESGVEKGTTYYYLFYSEPLNFTRGILGRYFNHFSGRFLFFEGDWQSPLFSPPYHGMLTLAELILLPIGTIVLVKNIQKKEYLFVLLWLLLAPLPAVLSKDAVHAVRALNMQIPLAIISGLGLYAVWTMKNRKFILRPALVIILIASYIYYLDAYFVHFAKSHTNLWGYGYKEIVQRIASIKSNYDHIKIQQSYAQPYIYFLFYEQYDPAKYQAQVSFMNGITGDVGFVRKLDKIQFGSLDYSRDLNIPGLVVVSKSDMPLERLSDSSKYKVISTINFPKQDDGFLIYAVNKDKI